jgi:hypothetical protein
MGICAIPLQRGFFLPKELSKCRTNEATKTCAPCGSGSYSVQKLASDSLGVCALNIQNAVVGSRYRIEVSSTGALVLEGDVAAADFTLSVPYYPPGNANNTLKIKIRKGTSAPKYQPFQTQVTASAAGATAFIAQIPDPIA